MPTYQLVANDTDTLINLTLTRNQAESTLKYINMLQTKERLYTVSLEEISLLNDNISILEKRIENYNEQIRVRDETLKFLLSNQELMIKEYEKGAKLNYKQGLYRGGAIGGIGVLILWLLIK